MAKYKPRRRTTTNARVAAPAEAQVGPVPLDQRSFSGRKLTRVFHDMGLPLEAFVKKYDEDSLRVRLGKDLTEEEIVAIESFLRHRSVTRLGAELGCTNSTAQVKVNKYFLDRLPQLGTE